MNIKNIIFLSLILLILVSCENHYAHECDYSEFWLCSCNLDGSDFTYHYFLGDDKYGCDYYGKVYFTPDDSKVIIKCEGYYFMNFDGSDSVEINFPVSPLNEIVISPDGNKIAYNAFDIYIMDSNGENWQNLTNSGNWWQKYPSFSADSKSLIFSGRIDTVANTISISSIDIETNIITDVVTDSLGMTKRYYFRHPRFHPNGEKIYYLLYDRNSVERKSKLYSVNIDGTEKTLLYEGYMIDTAVAFSEDGTKMVFRSNYQLYTINENNEINGLNITTGLCDTKISKSGSKILYRYDGWKIVDYNGLHKKSICRGKNAAFSSDDSKIFVVKEKRISLVK